MKKKKFKNYLKLGVLLFTTILITLTSCLNEELVLQEQSKIRVNHISFNDLKKTGDYERLITDLEYKFSRKYSQKTAQKSILANDGSFSINTDFIYETILGSITNYTFLLEDLKWIV